MCFDTSRYFARILRTNTHNLILHDDDALMQCFDCTGFVACDGKVNTEFRDLCVMLAENETHHTGSIGFTMIPGGNFIRPDLVIRRFGLHIFGEQGVEQDVRKRCACIII